MWVTRGMRRVVRVGRLLLTSKYISLAPSRRQNGKRKHTIIIPFVSFPPFHTPRGLACNNTISRQAGSSILETMKLNYFKWENRENFNRQKKKFPAKLWKIAWNIFGFSYSANARRKRENEDLSGDNEERKKVLLRFSHSCRCAMIWNDFWRQKLLCINNEHPMSMKTTSKFIYLAART